MEINKNLPSSIMGSASALRPQAAAADHTRVSLPNVGPQASSLGKDAYHFSAAGHTNGAPAAQIHFVDEAAPAESQFNANVHVDEIKPKEAKDRLLGFFTMTANQEQQISAAEARAFDRFNTAGWNQSRGSLSAKLHQAQMESFQPGLIELGSTTQNITDGEQHEVVKALQDYGEDVASIAITGRNRKDMQRYMEDKFFITLFDRDKQEFEDYFKGGINDFFGDNFGENDPNNAIVNKSVSASSENLVDLPDEKPKSDYKWRFVRPRLSVSMSGLDFKKVKFKPKIDLVRMEGPAQTELRVETELPYQINGTFEPEAKITARRIFNHKPGEYGKLKDNLMAEAQMSYGVADNQVRTTVGLRKQLSPDTSAGVYGLYRQSFDNAQDNDAAIGLNYQSRFD